jgi:hypothetical protein
MIEAHKNGRLPGAWINLMFDQYFEKVKSQRQKKVSKSDNIHSLLSWQVKITVAFMLLKL